MNAFFLWVYVEISSLLLKKPYPENIKLKGPFVDNEEEINPMMKEEQPQWDLGAGLLRFFYCGMIIIL